MKRFLSILVLASSLVGCTVEVQKDDESNSTKTRNTSGSDRGTPAELGDKIATEVSEKGATLELGEAKLEVPEGALSKDVKINIKVVEPPAPIPDEYRQASQVYECIPHGVEFEKPVRLEISYTDKLDETFVVLRLSDDEDDSWEIEEASKFKSSVATIELEHFSFFTVVYKVQRALSKPEAGIRDAGTADSDAFINISSDSGSAEDDAAVTSGTDGTLAADGSVDTSVVTKAGTGNAGCEGNQVLPLVTDFSQDGPFATTTESNTGPNGSCTVFRPDPLGTDGFLHPMITFGPGIVTSGGISYTTLLTHLATLGYVVIAVETLSGGPGAQANTDAMVNALDWLIAQNNAAGVYQGMLAVNCGVAMGYSIGASATPFVGEHPAVVTGVAIHGHIQMQTAEPHGPVLFLTGNGPAAVGDQVSQVVSGLNSAPGLMALYEGQGHMDVIMVQLQAGQPEFTAMTAWLRYWVNGDESAKNYFWGPGCVMCSDSSWTLQGNALWDALSL
jgi:hypothetical protein